MAVMMIRDIWMKKKKKIRIQKERRGLRFPTTFVEVKEENKGK